MHGGMGRLYGSLGLALDHPCTSVSVGRGTGLTVAGQDSTRALAIANSLWPLLGDGGGVAVTVKESIPAHSGFGSGTQLALAMGTAFGMLVGHKPKVEVLARLAGRGARSGIGLAAFQKGGLILDAGTGIGTDTGQRSLPPVLCRLPFPRSWSIVLVLNPDGYGLHGSDEEKFFRQPPQMESGRAATICRLVLLRLLPAVLEKDCISFGSALTELQHHTGDYFAAVQGGKHFISGETEQAVRFMLENGAVGGGQSSWGPSGFAVFPSAKLAAVAIKRAERHWGQNLRFSRTSACNKGASISNA